MYCKAQGTALIKVFVQLLRKQQFLLIADDLNHFADQEIQVVFTDNV